MARRRKLTKKQIDACLVLYRSGMTYEEIAVYFPVSVNTIWRAVNNYARIK